MTLKSCMMSLHHNVQKAQETRAKDVLPNIDRMQVAISCTPVTPWRPRNGPVSCLYFVAYDAGLTIHCQWG